MNAFFYTLNCFKIIRRKPKSYKTEIEANAKVCSDNDNAVCYKNNDDKILAGEQAPTAYRN